MSSTKESSPVILPASTGLQNINWNFKAKYLQVN